MPLFINLLLLSLPGLAGAFLPMNDKAFLAHRRTGSAVATFPSPLALFTATEPSVIEESAMTTFSGAGSAQVDMNQYNLPSLEAIAEEWSAVIAPATPLREEGIYLEAKSKREIMVDTVKVQIPRKVGQGLGLELLELAGGREDGLGITIVSGLVPGGCAEGSGIMEGDCISKVEVVMGNSLMVDNVGASAGLVEEKSEQRFSVSTECLGYDKTVQAIGSLPPAESDSEKVIITLKRLRRKPTVKINFQYPPEMQEDDITIQLFAGENLRRAMLVKGLKLNDPLARRFDSGGRGDCGAEGTCATCAVSIVRGSDLLNPPGSTETQLFKETPRWRLSCKAIVGYGMKEGEMTVRLSPRQWSKE